MRITWAMHAEAASAATASSARAGLLRKWSLPLRDHYPTPSTSPCHDQARSGVLHIRSQQLGEQPSLRYLNGCNLKGCFFFFFFLRKEKKKKKKSVHGEKRKRLRDGGSTFLFLWRIENWREEKAAKQHFDSVPRSALSHNWTCGTRHRCSGLRPLPRRGANPQSCWDTSSRVPWSQENFWRGLQQGLDFNLGLQRKTGYPVRLKCTCLSGRKR